MTLNVRDQSRVVAQRFMAIKHLFFVLGKVYGEPVAVEGACILNKMSYIHGAGYI